MFSRMTVLQVSPERIDEGVEIYRTSVLPEARKQDGYRGACVLVDRALGRAISITFWRAEKDALANEENLYYQEQLVKFLSFLAGPMIREAYEVKVFDIHPPAGRRSASKKKPPVRTAAKRPAASRPKRKR
jgi:hypothetical protein